jgi:hypothetical protein
MPSLTTVSFRVRERERGGPTGGRTLSHEVPDFEFDSFMRAPNAQEFIKKTYFATVKKIIREVEERKNGSVKSDLLSYESIIARSLAYTQEEISDWIGTRDWKNAKEIKDMDKWLPVLQKELPPLASRKHNFDKETADSLASVVIAAVADSPDPIADFMFTVLTQPRTSDDWGFLEL